MFAWAKRWSPIIAVVSGFGQAVAAIAAAVALWFMWLQISETQRGLDHATDALRATTAYQFQKDGRELLAQIANDKTVFHGIFGGVQVQSPQDEIKQRIQVSIYQIINFYSSVYNQWESGTIDDQLWASFLREFCSFVQRDAVKPIWAQAVQRKYHRPGFLELGERCGKS